MLWAWKGLFLSQLSLHFPYGPKWSTTCSSSPGSLRYHLPTLCEHDLSLRFSKLKIKQKFLWTDSNTAQNHAVWKPQNRVNITGKLPRKFKISYTFTFTCLLIVGGRWDFNKSISQFITHSSNPYKVQQTYWILYLSPNTTEKQYEECI